MRIAATDAVDESRAKIKHGNEYLNGRAGLALPQALPWLSEISKYDSMHANGRWRTVVCDDPKGRRVSRPEGLA